MSAFSDLYSTLRTFLGDTGATALYSNDQLDLGIRAALLQEDGFDETGSNTGLITPDVSAKADKLRISLRSAIAMLSPQSDAISWRNPVAAGSRQNSRLNGHLSYLEELLDKVVNGEDIEPTAYNEWDQWGDGTDNVTNAVSKLG